MYRDVGWVAVNIHVETCRLSSCENGVCQTQKHRFSIFTEFKPQYSCDLTRCCPSPYDLYCVGGTLSLTQSIFNLTRCCKQQHEIQSNRHCERVWFAHRAPSNESRSPIIPTAVTELAPVESCSASWTHSDFPWTPQNTRSHNDIEPDYTRSKTKSPSARCNVAQRLPSLTTLQEGSDTRLLAS